MNREFRRTRPFWRAADRRALRPGLWLLVLAAVGMMLVEVWQSSRMAELCLRLEQTRSQLTHAQANLEYARARLARATTRSELVPLASQLGLAPADAQQVVHLPSAYLAAADDGSPESVLSPALAWAERASGALVPEARARGRDRTD